MTHLTKTGSDIPADHIQFNDAHTEAWWSVPTLFGMPFVKFPDGFMDVRNAFDRPCEPCDGTCWIDLGDPGRDDVKCDDCIDGRHTFTIDVPSLLTPDEWCKRFGVRIADPDGWDRRNFLESWNQKIDRHEFMQRMGRSTILGINAIASLDEVPATHTYRVSVVPGMVLPITPVETGAPPQSDAIEVTPDGSAVLRKWRNRYAWSSWTYQTITLPSAAAPGMYAVKLAVHQ
jgi:hypothetical protein